MKHQGYGQEKWTRETEKEKGEGRRRTTRKPEEKNYQKTGEEELLKTPRAERQVSMRGVGCTALTKRVLPGGEGGTGLGTG